MADNAISLLIFVAYGKALRGNAGRFAIFSDDIH